MLHGSSPASFPWHSARPKMPRSDAPAAAAASPGPAAQPGLIPDPAGFQHFFASRTLDQCVTLGGKPLDPSNAADWARAEALMSKLAQLCMVAPTTATPRENRNLPSGYTYLLQLVAHDLVQSSVLLSRANDRLFAFANVRDMPLRLETIYGGGPAQCPYAYQSDNGYRHRLRVGQTRKPSTGNGAAELEPGTLRDLARGTSGTASDGATGDYSEPCVADLRNDSHAIISQMVTLFHILHNKICDQLAANAALAALPDPIANTERQFIAAQVACILIYRAIVRRDLLPAVLHPAVLGAYDSGRATPVNGSAHAAAHGGAPDWRAPLELTHGVMRFAHAMARPTYSFNELTSFPTDPTGADGKAFPIGAVLAQNSQQSVDRMPFERKWIIDWRRFFGDGAVNFAMRIGPSASVGLELGIQEVDRSKLLIERDFLSSLAIQPLSVRALITGFQSGAQRDLIAASAFLKLDDGGGAPGWFKPISDWLAEQNERRGNLMSADEIRALARDPPLPFFVRFEADHDPDIRGQRLGVLGSLVFADVIYGILAQDPIVGIEGHGDLQSQLSTLAQATFAVSGAEQAFSFVPEIKTFVQLLAFLGDAIAFPTAE